MDGPLFTVLNFSSESVISFNYGCGTSISLMLLLLRRRLKPKIFHYLKKATPCVITRIICGPSANEIWHMDKQVVCLSIFKTKWLRIHCSSMHCKWIVKNKYQTYSGLILKGLDNAQFGNVVSFDTTFGTNKER